MPRTRLLVDLSPLRRHRDFRRVMTSQLFASVATQFVSVALPFQIFELSGHSSLQVGLISLTQLLPMLCGSAIGGLVADSYERKTVMWVLQGLLTLTFLGFAFDAMAHSRALWPLYLVAAVSAFAAGASAPARWAVVPALAGESDLVPASAIVQLVSKFVSVAGPSLAGVLLSAGYAPVYWIAIAASMLSVAGIWRLRPFTAPMNVRAVSFGAMWEGFTYLRANKVLASSFYVDFEAMVFGMPRALFPALALVVYHGGPVTYGLLSSAPAAGALTSAVVSGWVANIRRQGLGLIVCVCVWGGTIALAGVIPVLWIGVVLLATAGGADTVSVVFRSTILQSTVPDRIRGRMTATFLALASAGNRLGDTEAGLASALVGPQVAVWSGGLACMIGAFVFSWRVPELLSYDQSRARVAEPALSR